MTVTGLKMENRKGYLWVTFPGEIKRGNTQQIQNRIESSLTGKNDQIVLDLSNISNIYSVTVNLILQLRKLITESEGSLCLVNISKKCQSQIQLMHLDEVLTIYQSEKEICSVDNK